MDADSFHRLAKALCDSGEAASIEAAQAQFDAYGVRVLLGRSVIADTASQAIALTVINAASRSFMGKVQIESAIGNFELGVPGFKGETLSSFMEWGGVLNCPWAKADRWPTIYIGHPDEMPPGSIRPWSHGWFYGVGRQDIDSAFFAPACVAAAGIAVSEAFSVLRQDNAYAGRRALTMSLWDAGSKAVGSDQGPLDVDIPSIRLVGLGHLGQAYAWTLGFMRQRSGSTLALQDIDVVTQSTVSTSMVTVPMDVGRLKTDVVRQWLASRGFCTSTISRRYDHTERVALADPTVALFGVDNSSARRAIEQAGFDFVVDAGLGSGFNDFRALRVRTFPGPSAASELWAVAPPTLDLVGARAYQALLEKGADPCGVTTLASRSVGAPFVGCVAAAYAVSELIRREYGQPPRAVVDLNLRDPARAEIF